MDNVNYNPKMLLRVVGDRLLAADPFVLFDSGGGLGIDPAWRFFADDLHAHAFDPQEEECAKLEREEKNGNVHYHAAFVGLSPDDAFHKSRATSEGAARSYFAPSAQMARGSSYAANLLKQQRAVAPPSSSLESTEQWSHTDLSSRTVSIGDFAVERDVTSIDFIKIDTDGRDLEAAASCRGVIRSANILGFMVECFFTGSDDATENSFHNVDAFMQRKRVRALWVDHRALLTRGAARRFSTRPCIKPFQVSRSGVTWSICATALQTIIRPCGAPTFRRPSC